MTLPGPAGPHGLARTFREMISFLGFNNLGRLD